jgi:hypothetical protein
MQRYVKSNVVPCSPDNLIVPCLHRSPQPALSATLGSTAATKTCALLADQRFQDALKSSLSPTMLLDPNALFDKCTDVTHDFFMSIQSLLAHHECSCYIVVGTWQFDHTCTSYQDMYRRKYPSYAPPARVSHQWLAFSAAGTPVDENTLGAAISIDPTLFQFTGEAWSIAACLDTAHDIDARRVGRVVPADTVW